MIQIEPKEIKTKNYTLYLHFWNWWWDWALPAHIEIETFHRDYFDIRFHLLCFNFNFTAVSHKFHKSVKGFMDDYKEGELKND